MRAKQFSLKPLAAASIGNALEWYDFGLFGYLAITFQQLFFPFDQEVKGLLSVFLIFAVGLFMRPLGGMIFGYIGDKFGRKPALLISIIAMAIPTFAIGILPTYQQAGIWAICLLITMRLIQGLSVGGELIGSMIFLVENAPSSHRGVVTGLIYSVGALGGLLGSLSGALLFSLFTEETILAWAWRLPFFIGIVIGGIGLYIRFKIGETPMFLALKEAKNTAKEPLKEAIKKHPREIVVIFLLVTLQAVGFYLPFVYLPTWMKSQAHFSSSSSFYLNSLGLVFLMLLIPIFGALSDRLGRRKILLIGSLLSCLLAFPLFKILSSVPSASNPWPLALCVILVFAIMTALYQGPLPAMLSELLSTKNRYLSLVLGYNISAAIFGGITPYLSTYLIETTGYEVAPSFLLIATGATAFFVLFFAVKETYYLTLK